MFHPDDVDGLTPLALIILKELSNDNYDDLGAYERDQYIADIKTVKQFILSLMLTALFDSFHSFSRQLQFNHEYSGISEYCGSSDVKILNYVRDV